MCGSVTLYGTYSVSYSSDSLRCSGLPDSNSNAWLHLTSSNESILLFNVYLNCILLKYFLVSICKFCCTVMYMFKELVLVHIIINLVYEVINWFKYVFTNILFYF